MEGAALHNPLPHLYLVGPRGNWTGTKHGTTARTSHIPTRKTHIMRMVQNRHQNTDHRYVITTQRKVKNAKQASKVHKHPKVKGNRKRRRRIIHQQSGHTGR